MIPMTIIFREPAWPELEAKDVFRAEGEVQVAVLDHGTTSGRPSVAIRVDLKNGRVVIAETSARLLCTAAKMIMAKYPDLFGGE